MVAISTYRPDPTLEAADAALAEKENAQPARPYLGMSGIGHDCERNLWYGFRWVAKVTFDAIVHKKFIDGHRTEDLVINRLRMVKGIEIHSVDPQTRRQFALADLGGHFRGHMDFVVLGLLQAPKTWHVGEVKATEEVSKLQNAIVKFGEKDALEQWHPTYFAQAQCYMGYTGLERHYLVAASPGGRHWISVRTDFQPDKFMRLKAKAERVVFSAHPPEKISGNADFYKCRWCSFAPQCHGGEMPDSNCRTCLHSTPMESAGWMCERFKINLDVEKQREGCGAHLFIPSLVPGVQEDAGDDWVSYRMRDGSEWVDGVRT